MENHVPIKSITVGQCGKFADVLVAALQKSGLPSEPTQQVLEQQGAALADEFVASVCSRVEAITGPITRHVAVNRARSPMVAIIATGRNKYLSDDVVAAMPQGEGNEANVRFFKIDRYISDADLDKEYDLRGLKPVDPYALAAVNEADPAFADEHPNGTHWKDVNGNWCYATFSRGDVGRYVSVGRSGSKWGDYWFFAGVRK